MADGRNLFEKAKPFLLNPVRKRVYTERDLIPNNLPLAGLSALSEYSMIAAPGTDIYAYSGKQSKLQGIERLVDEKQVEVWHYDPLALSVCGRVADPLSVAISMIGSNDERIEQAVDYALENIWGQQ